MALLTRAETRERHREKTIRVLRFLRTSIYSTSDLLGEVMGVQSRYGIYKTLASLERKQLIRRQTYDELGGAVTLWGITSAGQEACLQDGEEPIAVIFNTSKVSFTRLQHYLSIQQIRIRGEAAGWGNFIYCDRRSLHQGEPDHTEDTIREKIRPDLLASSPDGRRVAIEAELHLKWTPRYKEHVIPGHVRRINAEEYQQVVWVCRTKDREETLRGILQAAVKELRDDRQLHLERTSQDYKTFNITSLEAWPNF